MPDDVILHKAAIIERCVKRVHEEYIGHEDELITNFTRQDSVILNIQRACEASIGLALHLVRKKKIGLPRDSREAFGLLLSDGLISKELSENLQKMVGFRNIAVHDYQELDVNILRNLIEHRLGDLLDFSKILVQDQS